jgi:hypothetical protein
VQWGLLPIVAVPIISNLRAVNTPDSSTPPPPPNIPGVQSLTRFSRQNRGGSLPALDDEYRFVVNDIGLTDLL